MLRFRNGILLTLALCTFVVLNSYPAASHAAPEGKDTVLKAAQITAKLFPERVFYQGKTAPTELRNTGGIRFADGAYFLAGLVDNSGYSTAVKEKYQAYVLSEVPLQFEDQEVKAGAYGAGFVSGYFIMTDIGAHDLLRVAAKHDMEMKRPLPLQVVAGSDGMFRLYHGRDYVEFRRGE